MSKFTGKIIKIDDDAHAIVKNLVGTRGKSIREIVSRAIRETYKVETSD